MSKSEEGQEEQDQKDQEELEDEEVSEEDQEEREEPRRGVFSLWDFLAIIFAMGASFGLGFYSFQDNTLFVIMIGLSLVSFFIPHALYLAIAIYSLLGLGVCYVGDFGLICSFLSLILSLVCLICGNWWAAFDNSNSRQIGSKYYGMSFLVLLIFCSSFPFSKLNNFENLEKDKRLVTELVVSKEGDSTKITLPRKLAGEHQYLSQVLSIEFEVNGKSSSIPWSEAVRYTEGDFVWYKLLLPIEPTPDNVVADLFFDHPWIDYRTSVTLRISPVLSIGDGLSSSTIGCL